jgi:hypothetical protein
MVSPRRPTRTLHSKTRRCQAKDRQFQKLTVTASAAEGASQDSNEIPDVGSQISRLPASDFDRPGVTTVTFTIVLTELIPLALVVALSPLSIIPAVLVLHTPRPRPTGLAYLLGWLVGLAGLTAIFVELSGLMGGGGTRQPPSWASWLRIVVGAALIAFGLYKWFTRKQAEHTPKWMSSLTTISPARAAVTAVVLVIVNPKVLLICAAAGLAIGTEGLGPTGVWLAELYYVAVAASTAAIPILAYLVVGERLDQPLARLKEWMEANHATLIAAILVAIGLMVLYKGIHAL